jgi:hypothetical protein
MTFQSVVRGVLVRRLCSAMSQSFAHTVQSVSNLQAQLRAVLIRRQIAASTDQLRTSLPIVMLQSSLRGALVRRQNISIQHPMPAIYTWQVLLQSAILRCRASLVSPFLVHLAHLILGELYHLRGYLQGQRLVSVALRAVALQSQPDPQHVQW